MILIIPRGRRPIPVRHDGISTRASRSRFLPARLFSPLDFALAVLAVPLLDFALLGFLGGLHALAQLDTPLLAGLLPRFRRF